MLNLICITGRLVADPNLIECASGTKVCKFTIACDRDVKDANGERATDFIDCVAWKKAGEAIAAFWSKGRLICLCGRLQIRHYTAKDGSQRRSAEINVRQSWFCDKKSDYPDQGEGYESGHFVDAYSDKPQGQLDLLTGDDDDFPF